MNGECRKTDLKVSEHTFMPVTLQQYLWSTQNNLQSVNERTANVVKPVSKPVNTRFHPYLGNSTTDRRNITSKVLKKNDEYRKTCFKSEEHTFSIVSWQQYLQSMQKKPEKCYKKKGKCRKISFKSLNSCFWPYFGNSTSDWRKKTHKS